MHRQNLKKQQEDKVKKQEEMSRTDIPEPFKLKKFTQIESRIKQDISHQNQHDEVRPHDSSAKKNGLLRQRPGSARPGAGMTAAN